MNKDDLKKNIEESGQFSFSRSGGPGGQNVNKVNTKVLLTLPVESLISLNETERRRVRLKLAARLNSRDELYLQIQEERSQVLNRQLAVDRIVDLIADSLKRKPVRKKTRPSKASRERRLNEKKKHSNKKKSRGRFTGQE